LAGLRRQQQQPLLTNHAEHYWQDARSTIGKFGRCLQRTGIDRRSLHHYMVCMPVTDQQVMAKLKECYDPELPCNIIDLGLVYGVQLQSVEGASDTRVDVKMTLTSQACPLAGQISAQVQRKLLELQGIAEANVEVVFDPPWSLSRVTPDGKKTLGLP
jgi:metal-sulfur cluster biosynthetic enzyme